MYKESNNTKKYEFNVTWRVNSEPYFSTTTHTERIDVNIDANVTFPTATDDESDPIHYFIVNNTFPVPANMNHANSSETVIEFILLNSNIHDAYEFVLEPWEYENHTYCGTPMNVTLIVNTLPVSSASLNSNYQQVPYISNVDITDTCPWFTDADGDTLTVKIILSDKIIGESDSNTITATKCSVCVQHYWLRIYIEQYK